MWILTSEVSGSISDLRSEITLSMNLKYKDLKSESGLGIVLVQIYYLVILSGGRLPVYRRSRKRRTYVWRYVVPKFEEGTSHFGQKVYDFSYDRKH